MAAPVFRSASTMTSQASGTTWTPNLPAGHAEGDILLLFTMQWNVDEFVANHTVSNGNGTTWTRRFMDDLPVGGPLFCFSIFEAERGASLTAPDMQTNDESGAASGLYSVMIAVSGGLSGGDALEGLVWNAGNYSTWALTDTIDTTDVDRLMLTVYSGINDRDLGDPGGSWTEASEQYSATGNDARIVVDYQEAATAGSYTGGSRSQAAGDDEGSVYGFAILPAASASTYEEFSNTTVSGSITTAASIVVDKNITITPNVGVSFLDEVIGNYNESISFGLSAGKSLTPTLNSFDNINIGSTLDITSEPDASLNAYIIPGGVGNGSSWGTGANLANLNFLIAQVGPGGTVYIRADDGDIYPSNAYALWVGGNTTNPVTVTGQASNGDIGYAIISGSRTDWTLSANSEVTTNTAVGWTHGDNFLSLELGADYISFEYLDVRRVGSVFTQSANLTNITYQNLEAYNIRRFIDSSAGENINNVLIRNVNVTGFSKQCIRMQGDSNNWLIDNVNLNSGRQDWDNFATAISLDETAHTLTVNTSVLENCHDSLNAYWNGDGFKSEVGNYDLNLYNVDSHGHTDGGIDSKGQTSYANLHVYDNKVNLRMWANSHIATDVFSNTANLRGGTGASAHVGLYYNNPVNRGATAIINNLTLNETGDAYIVWHAGNNCNLTVNNYTLAYTEPPAELNHISGGVTGNVLTWIPPFPFYPFFNDVTNGGGALSNYANANHITTGPVTPIEPPSSALDDIIFCMVGTNCTDAGAGSFSESVGGWTLFNESTVPDGTWKGGLYWRRRTASPVTISVSYTGSGSGTYGWMVGYTGAANTVDPFDIQSDPDLYTVNTSDDADSVGPDVTTQGSYRKVINFHITQDNSGYSSGPSGGWTSRYNGSTNIGADARFAVEDIPLLVANTQTGSTRGSIEDGVAYGVALFSEGNEAGNTATYNETVSLATDVDVFMSSLLTALESGSFDLSQSIAASGDLSQSDNITLSTLASLITDSNLIISLVATLSVELSLIQAGAITSEAAIALQQTLSIAKTVGINMNENILISIIDNITNQASISVDKIISLSTDLGYTNDELLSITKLISLSSTLGLSNDNNISFNEALSLALAAGFDDTGAITTERAISLSTLVNNAVNNNVQMEQAISFATIAAHLISELHQIEENIAMGVVTEKLTSIGSIFIESITLALTEGMSDSRTVTAEASASINLTATDESSATVDIEEIATLTTDTDITDERTVTAEEAATIAAQANIETSKTLTAEEITALGVQSGISDQSTQDIEEAANFDIEAGEEGLGSRQLDNAVVPAIQPGLSAVPVIDYYEVLSFGINNSLISGTEYDEALAFGILNQSNLIIDSGIYDTITISINTTKSIASQMIQESGISFQAEVVKSSTSDLISEKAITFATEVAKSSVGGKIIEENISVATSVEQGEAPVMSVDRATSYANIMDDSYAALLGIDETIALQLLNTIQNSNNIDQYTSIVLTSLLDLLVAGTVVSGGSSVFEEIISLATNITSSVSSIMNITESIIINTNVGKSVISPPLRLIVQESVTKLMKSNPGNVNYLHQNKFKFTLTNFPNLVYFTSRVNLPDVSIGSQEIPNPLNYHNVPAEKMRFGDLTVTFRVNEDLDNYKEIHEWIEAIGTPEEFDTLSDYLDDKKLSSRDKRAYNIASDATLHTLTNVSKPNVRIVFRNIFPVSLSGIDFDLEDTNNSVATVTFKVDSFYYDN